MKISRISTSLRFAVSRLSERLWLKPLLVGMVSVMVVLLAGEADKEALPDWVPEVRRELLDSLLSIMASSMLVIATFAISSMVAAYGMASTSASPRAFRLIVADDTSQRALSTFIGAFIFSIVAMISFQSKAYGQAGLFVLCFFTVSVFAIVVLVFVRWMDSIARLGLIHNTIEKVEQATMQAFERRRISPCLQGAEGAPGSAQQEQGFPVYCSTIGYLQRIDVHTLQECADSLDATIVVGVLPGSFITPDRCVARLLWTGEGAPEDSRLERARGAFTIGRERTFDDDPRYGIIVLSQIADRALSPAVNDPGTAIDILGVIVRLLHRWQAPLTDEERKQRQSEDVCKRVILPALLVSDLFEDAFTAIARDGAGFIEVGIRLQKSLTQLAMLENPEVRAAAHQHSTRALDHARMALALESDYSVLAGQAPLA